MSLAPVTPEISQLELDEAAKQLNAPGSGYEDKITHQTGTVHGIDKDALEMEMRDILFNKLRSRAWIKKQCINGLKSLHEELTRQIEEYEREQERQAREREQQAEALSEIIDKIHLAGFSVASVIDVLQEKAETEEKERKSANRATYRAKYKISIFEREYLWAGLGRIPKPYKCFLAKGHDLEKYRLDPDTAPLLHGKQDYSINEKFDNQVVSLLQKYKREIAPK